MYDILLKQIVGFKHDWWRIHSNARSPACEAIGLPTEPPEELYLFYMGR